MIYHFHFFIFALTRIRECLSSSFIGGGTRLPLLLVSIICSVTHHQYSSTSICFTPSLSEKEKGHHWGDRRKAGSEGDRNENTSLPPRIFHFSSQSYYIGHFPLPSLFSLNYPSFPLTSIVSLGGRSFHIDDYRGILIMISGHFQVSSPGHRQVRNGMDFIIFIFILPFIISFSFHHFIISSIIIFHFNNLIEDR